MNIITQIVARLVTLFTADSATVVASVAKLEAKVEAAIAKDVVKLLGLRNAADAIEAARADTDAAQNAAYKLLHNIGGLTR